MREHKKELEKRVSEEQADIPVMLEMMKNQKETADHIRGDEQISASESQQGKQVQLQPQKLWKIQITGREVSSVTHILQDFECPREYSACSACTPLEKKQSKSKNFGREHLIKHRDKDHEESRNEQIITEMKLDVSQVRNLPNYIRHLNPET